MVAGVQVRSRRAYVYERRRPEETTLYRVVQGRERLLRYILRPPFAQERVQTTPEGLVPPVGDHEARRIAKRGFA